MFHSSSQSNHTAWNLASQVLLLLCLIVLRDIVLILSHGTTSRPAPASGLFGWFMTMFTLLYRWLGLICALMCRIVLLITRGYFRRPSYACSSSSSAYPRGRFSPYIRPLSGVTQSLRPLLSMSVTSSVSRSRLLGGRLWRCPTSSCAAHRTSYQGSSTPLPSPRRSLNCAFVQESSYSTSRSRSRTRSSGPFEHSSSIF